MMFAGHYVLLLLVQSDNPHKLHFTPFLSQLVSKGLFFFCFFP